MTEIPSDFVTALDTIDFEQLVELGRREIPRYAADWTDHNLHDPGMSLIDLLAWIVDQQIYRIGRVGGRQHRAFAALLGQVPHGPQAAHGLVWPSQPLPEDRLVQEGTAVVCAARPTLPFVVARTLFLTAARPLSALLHADGGTRPLPESEVDGTTWTLRDIRYRNITALTLQFDRPVGSPNDAAEVSFGFDVSPPPEAKPSPDGPAWGPVQYAYRQGEEGPWNNLSVLHDGTQGLALSGQVVLKVPQRTSRYGRPALRISFDKGFFPVPPRIHAVTVNALPVTQLDRSGPASFAETGTGAPDQRVEIATENLVTPASRPAGPLLEVKINDDTWTITDDLRSSGPNDPHLEVHPDHLLFGNGLNGRCPPARAELRHTGLNRTAGAEGNVRPGLIWRVPSLRDLVADYGVNRHGLTGGRDRTSATELVARARSAATQRKAMVTDDDVVQTVLALPGMAVGRAEVISRFDPRLPDRPIDGARTLIVVPAGFTPSPTLEVSSPDTRAAVPVAYVREVAARLKKRRVLGERLIVQGPRVTMVTVEITVTTESWASFPQVAAAVRQAVSDRLSAVRRTGDVQPWPLGRDLTVSDVLSIVARVEGVAAVPEVRLAPAGGAASDPAGPAAGHGPVVVGSDGVVVAGMVTVEQQIVGPPSSRAPSDRGWG